MIRSTARPLMQDVDARAVRHFLPDDDVPILGSRVRGNDINEGECGRHECGHGVLCAAPQSCPCAQSNTGCQRTDDLRKIYKASIVRVGRKGRGAPPNSRRCRYPQTRAASHRDRDDGQLAIARQIEAACSTLTAPRPRPSCGVHTETDGGGRTA